MNPASLAIVQADGDRTQSQINSHAQLNQMYQGSAIYKGRDAQGRYRFDMLNGDRAFVPHQGLTTNGALRRNRRAALSRPFGTAGFASVPNRA
jgi:hypothetical protein